jgi:hypothetical protein
MFTCGTAFRCLLLMACLCASLGAAEKPDEYGDVCWKREKEILRNFAVQLKNEPEARGYLIHYAGRLTPSLDVAHARGRRAREYLVRLGVGAERIVTVDGGFREHLTWEVWVVPPGATPPYALPTVKRDEVKVVAESPKQPCPESGRGRD